jgi:hypothetical protein
MIDRTLINPAKLLDAILDNCAGNINKWWDMVEIVLDYMPPYPRPDTKPTRVSLKCGENYLRDLGWGNLIWNTHYGESSEFYTAERAILALMKAPVPPYLLKKECWEKTP